MEEIKGFFNKYLDFVLIFIGSLLLSIALMVFLIPNKINTGGVSGIATIFYHLFNFPAGVTMLVLNIPLFIIGIKIFGKKFGIKTIWGIIWVSIFCDLIDKVLQIEPITDSRFLATIYGGLLLGAGLGIIFRGRGTTGGSDIVARIINKYFNLSLGWSFMMVDTLVIIAGGLVFADVDLILFCLIALGIVSKVTDTIIEGVVSEKGLFIISKKWENISKRIIVELKRGVTGFNSVGLYTNKAKKTLYCVVSRRQIETVRRIVKEEDQKAFITVQNISIMQGEGFRSQTSVLDE
ncbi:MAG: YitT family protein [Candidatus Marinimicrobia bacterium]|nr:YitT family protein [Candidatus Neomarinimicrobiota bacterium]